MNRVASEQALWEGNEYLELAEASGIGVWDFDLLTGELRGRPQFFRVMGLEPTSEPISIEVTRALRHPDDRDLVIDGFKQAIERGVDSYEKEYRIIRPDGQTRWILGRGRVIRDPTGKPIRYSGIDIDITERKRAEEALAQSESRYGLLLEHANDIVATLELDGTIVSINPAARQILGYDPAELIGKTIYEFVPREQVGAQIAQLQRKIEGEASTLYDLEVVTKDRRRRILGVNSSLIFDASGKPLLIQSIARDVTERREAEGRQLVLVRELQHRTKNLLAVIQAMASRTLKAHPDVTGFIGRLHALAHAQEFVTSGSSAGVPLRALIEAQLNAFGGRAQITGEEVMLTGSFAQSFALVVHELATNALKYGAFSSGEGSAAVEWRKQTRDGGDVLRFSWIESGGPPVHTPASRGFGTQLISAIGDAQIVFALDGLRYETEVPIAQALQFPAET